MQKTILMTVKLLIQQFDKFYFNWCFLFLRLSDIIGNLGNYITVHHFISFSGEFMARIMGNKCEIDSLTNPTIIYWRSGRSGIIL